MPREWPLPSPPQGHSGFPRLLSLLYPSLQHRLNLQVSSNVYSWSPWINSRVLLGLKRSKKNGKDKGFSEDWVHYQMQSYPPGPQASLQEWRSVRATAHYRCPTEETKKLWRKLVLVLKKEPGVKDSVFKSFLKSKTDLNITYNTPPKASRGLLVCSPDPRALPPF